MDAAPRRWGIRYRAHNGLPRPAVVLVPAEYGPENPPSPLPLVISPHGRGIRAIANAQWWRDLPARGGFAVICPAGMGRRLPLHSWGWRGQIADLARMPSILQATMPWLRVDRRRVYAVGGSMGGQEALLLVGQHPQLLAGAVVFDSVTNFYTRYRDFALIRNGRRLQALARLEVGGTPSSKTREYVLRSPTHWVREVAGAGVPLQLWWRKNLFTVTLLVERRRRDRRRPAAPVGAFLRGASQSAAARAHRGRRRFLVPHGRNLFAPAVTRCGQVAGPARALARLSARATQITQLRTTSSTSWKA